MPIRAYKCQECGDEFDHLEKMYATPLTECKKCGGQLSQVLTTCKFKFKEPWRKKRIV